jgi:hypothetical protein
MGSAATISAALPMSEGRRPSSGPRPGGGRRRLKHCLATACATVAAALTAGPTPASAAALPQLGAVWANEVTATSARLHAEVDPEGQSTTYRFEYLPAAAYAANLEAGREGFSGAADLPAGPEPSVGSGSAPKAVFQQLTGLAGETTYRYRVVAKNASGPSASAAFSFTTQILGGDTLLLDERGWEMVSPVDKNGGQVQGPEGIGGGGVLQAAADGQSITFSSTAAFGPEAEGAPWASQYLSTRGVGVWLTRNLTAPTVSDSYGDSPDGVPYQLFSDDLSLGLLLQGRRCGEAEPCQRQYSLVETGTGASAGSPEAQDLGFAGASPGLNHVVLSTCAALTVDATEVPAGEGCDAAYPNLYEWGNGQLRLVNLLPGETQGTPGADLGAQSGAVSTDGRRVYFSHGGNLYLRDESDTVLVAKGATFQAATPDGSFAFFTREGHLFRYGVQTEPRTVELALGTVEGVFGVSDDGTRVYYQAAGGAVFLWNSGTTKEVAAAGSPTDYPPTTGTARVSADGSLLLFVSKAPLTGYDNTDQLTGEADSEVFLYELGPDRLTCLSCNPTEGRPIGPSSVPGAYANGSGPSAVDSYKPRVLAAGRRRVFFESSDSLVMQDTDSARDVYEWEAVGEGNCQRGEGCLALVSSGRSAGGASFVDASAGGSDAFFLTGGSLISSDPGSVDLYDARVGGGFPQPSVPIPCEGDACQPLPSEPEDPEPGTVRYGPGNPPLRFKKRHHHHKHRRHRGSGRR